MVYQRQIILFGMLLNLGLSVYSYLPKGAKWFLKGVKSPSLRIQLAPLGTCWYIITEKNVRMMGQQSLMSGSPWGWWSFIPPKIWWYPQGFRTSSPKALFENSDFSIPVLLLLLTHIGSIFFVGCWCYELNCVAFLSNVFSSSTNTHHQSQEERCRTVSP